MCCMMMHAMDHAAHNSPTTANGGPQEESLHDILRRRYALGEISGVQFEEMKQALGLTADSEAASRTGHAHPMGGGGTP